MKSINFGASLKTTPEQFLKLTDTLNGQKHVEQEFTGLRKFLTHPAIDRLSAGDSVELERFNIKNKFGYNVIYRRKGIEAPLIFKMVTKNIEENGVVKKGAENFSAPSLIKQIAYVIAHFNGKMPKKLFFTFKDVLKNLFSA